MLALASPEVVIANESTFLKKICNPESGKVCPFKDQHFSNQNINGIRIIIGSAPASKETLDFMKVALSIPARRLKNRQKEMKNI